MAYGYDGNNKRVKTYDAINDRTTIFVYDANGLLAAEYTITVPPPSVPVISYLTEDALGSVRVTTNSFAEVKARRDFLPFGEELYAGIAGRTSNQKYSSSTDDTRTARTTPEQHGRHPNSTDDTRTARTTPERNSRRISATRRRDSILHSRDITRRCKGGSRRRTSSREVRMSYSISKKTRATIRRSTPT